MKRNLLPVIVAAALLCSGTPLFSAETAGAKKELQTLVGKIQTKLREGKKTEKDLAEELKEFDTLLAQHKDDKTDDVAQILYMKAMIYTQVFKEEDKGDALLDQLKKDFPNSQAAKQVAQQEASTKIQRSLAVGTKFPGFDKKDVTGKPMSIANYKGKVVLVDFWAVWCGPCVSELPNVLKTYEKHHPKGFEIVGISLDKDEGKLKDFTKSKNMTWQQFFDGKMWQNELAVKYGVNSIPATYLLDGEGKIIAKNLRGEALEEAVAQALAKK